jgi:hypothetical protein
MSYAFPAGSSIKTTNYINENGYPTQTAQNYLWDGNVYPIYETVLYIPALPNDATGTYAHNILNYPTSPQLLIGVTAFGTNASNATVGIPNVAAGVTSVTINPTDVIIVTTANLSTWTGQVTIRYCQQTVFTPITQF